MLLYPRQAALDLVAVIAVAHGLAVGTNAQACDVDVLVVGVRVLKNDVRARQQTKVFENSGGNLAPRRRIDIGVFRRSGQHDVRNGPVQ